MAGRRQPTDLLMAKGRKHLTKAEIRERKARELLAANDDIYAPDWLTKEQKARFMILSAELVKMDIMANVDCEALARVVVAESQYIEITKKLDSLPIMKAVWQIKRDENGQPIMSEKVPVMEPVEVVNEERAALLIQQDRAWKQCRQGAADFGLSVAQRCRIVAPKAKEPEKKNKFDRFKKGPEAAK